MAAQDVWDLQEHATTFRILAGATAARQYVGKGPFISHPYLVIFKLGGPSESAGNLVIV